MAKKVEIYIKLPDKKQIQVWSNHVPGGFDGDTVGVKVLQVDIYM